MRNVLNFLIRYNSWILLTFLIVVSCLLLFNFNNFQQSVWLTSANSVSASLNSVYGEVNSYMGLRETNAALEERNAALQTRIYALESELQAAREQIPDTASLIPQPERFSYITASVIGNSQNRVDNYFTINKGTDQGIRPGMGVVNSFGLLGIVDVSQPHVSRVISVLNNSQRFSVKISGTEFVGSLHWRYNDPSVAYMEEVPRHAKYYKNSLVVTSGFSTALPEGVPVGRIIGKLKSSTDNYLTLKIQLLPDFRHLGKVWVIRDIYSSELDSLAIKPAAPNNMQM